MDYIITQGKEYVAFNIAKNKLELTTDIHKATKLSMIKANNIIKNQVPPIQRDKYQVVAFDTLNPKKENKNKQSKTTNKNTSTVPLQVLNFNWSDTVDKLETFYKQILEHKQNLTNQHSLVDKELSDIYHFITHNKPPAHIRTKIYKIQQEVLLKRENIKTELRYLNVVLNSLNNNLAEGDVKKQLTDAQTQQYKSRTDIYEKLIKLT